MRGIGRTVQLSAARQGKIAAVHAVTDPVQEQPAVIDRFAGSTHWLNNRSWHRAAYDGRIYMSVEHAYAAAKSTRDFDRSETGSIVAPQEAYEYGQRVPLRADWDTRVRYEVMYTALAAKFRDAELAAKLEATGDALLIDGVTNHDQHWSDCRCERHFEFPGANHLGRALMALRSSTRDEPVDRWPRAAIIGTRDLTAVQLDWMRAELTRVLRKLRLEHGTSTFISGMAMGAGVEGTEVASNTGGYALWAYLPFPDQTAGWPAAWVQRQETARTRVGRTVMLGDKPVGANRKRGLRLEFDRDRLMIRDANVLIAVHDRSVGGQTAASVALARELGVAVVTMDPVARAVVIARD